jgi:hypothetical protein
LFKYLQKINRDGVLNLEKFGDDNSYRLWEAPGLSPEKMSLASIVKTTQTFRHRRLFYPTLCCAKEWGTPCVVWATKTEEIGWATRQTALE